MVGLWERSSYATILLGDPTRLQAFITLNLLDGGALFDDFVLGPAKAVIGRVCAVVVCVPQSRRQEETGAGMEEGIPLSSVSAAPLSYSPKKLPENVCQSISLGN